MIIAIANQECYAGVWEEHYDDDYTLNNNNALTFDSDGVMDWDRKSYVRYDGSDVKNGKKSVYLLDRNIADRQNRKNVIFRKSSSFYCSNNKVYFDILTREISFKRDLVSDAIVYVEPFVQIAPYPSYLSDNTGGTITFLSEKIGIRTTNTLKVTNENESINFSVLKEDSLSNKFSYSLSAVKISDQGSFSILDKTDFPDGFSDDLNNNGAEKVKIVAKNDLTYAGSAVTSNAGHVVRAIENVGGSFSLHSSRFVILAKNNAVSPFGLDEESKLSSVSIGVFGQGGEFSFRSGEKGGLILAKSTESAFSTELVTGEHKTESYGFLLLSKYTPIVERNERGEFTGSKKMLGIDVKGGKVDFLNDNGGRYIISSRSEKDASYGLLSMGSNNEVNFSGNTEIYSNSFGDYDDAGEVAGGDGHAYGVVNVSGYTKVEGGAVRKAGMEYVTEKLEPEIYYDSGSRVNLESGSTLKLIVNSKSGNSFGLLQIGESSSYFEGSLEIQVNNATKTVGYCDSYAILVSGDDRKMNHLIIMRKEELLSIII